MELNKHEQVIFSLVKRYNAGEKIKDIARALNKSQASVYVHLRYLKKLGYLITERPRSPRTPIIDHSKVKRALAESIQTKIL